MPTGSATIIPTGSGSVTIIPTGSGSITVLPTKSTTSEDDDDETDCETDVPTIIPSGSVLPTIIPTGSGSITVLPTKSTTSEDDDDETDCETEIPTIHPTVSTTRTFTSDGVPTTQTLTTKLPPTTNQHTETEVVSITYTGGGQTFTTYLTQSGEICDETVTLTITTTCPLTTVAPGGQIYTTTVTVITTHTVYPDDWEDDGYEGKTMPVILPVAPLMMVNGNGMKKMMANVCQQVDQVLDLAQALGGVLVLDQVVVLLLVLVLDQVQILEQVLVVPGVDLEMITFVLVKMVMTMKSQIMVAAGGVVRDLVQVLDPVLVLVQVIPVLLQLLVDRLEAGGWSW